MTVETTLTKETAIATPAAHGSSDVILVSVYRHHGGVIFIKTVAISLMRETAPLQRLPQNRQRQHRAQFQNVHPTES